jgi:hypothetical protein
VPSLEALHRQLDLVNAAAPSAGSGFTCRRRIGFESIDT